MRRLRGGAGRPLRQRINIHKRHGGWLECTAVGQASRTDDVERIISADDVGYAPGARKATRILKQQVVRLQRCAFVPPERLPP